MSNADAADLYGLPIDEFIPARDALAKRVRADGDREAAAAVAALRKPSIAAWATNQAIRSQPAAARELWAAGEALLKAHSRVVAGRRGAGEALREASGRERAALRPLLDAAAGLLDHRGHSPTRQTMERVADTLHAAALDPDVRSEAVAGRLVVDHRWAGGF
jgi:hypothetical protein